jgi:hypothetical protein
VRWQCISNNCCSRDVVDSALVFGGRGHGGDSGSTVAQLYGKKECKVVMYKC